MNSCVVCKFLRNICRVAFVIIVGVHGAIPAQADELPSNLSDAVKYRNMGPYRAGAWVTDFAVPYNGPEHDHTFYVAARHGGVWKTTNNGTTFSQVFDAVASIGDVTIAPSDNNTVWIGTGENANARSTHAGAGVYKSSDGGASFHYMGLKETHHIARILIHPSNPEIVYVAAIGKLFSESPERGVFKTTDGGKSWEKVFYLGDKIGVIELAMDSHNPETLYAASYDKSRTPWHFEAGGPGSGLYKSTDGGANWSKLGGGLPTGDIGRIGVDVYDKNPNIVYAVVENATLRDPTQKEIDQANSWGGAVTQQYMGNEVFRSDDGGKSWKKTHANGTYVGAKAPYSFNQIFIDPNDDQKIYVNAVMLSNSNDGGKTWLDNKDYDKNRNLFEKAFGDVRTLWIDPENSKRMLFGSDGGPYMTYDGGKTAHHYYNIPIGEVYGIGVDNKDPYNIYAGLQDHESFKAPSNGWSGGVGLEDWVIVGIGDGGYNQLDSSGRYLYTTLQFCCNHRVDQVNGTRKDIHPRAPKGENPYKFPWTPSIQVSSFDDKTIYTGAQRLLKSTDRGESWTPISPDLTDKVTVDDGGKCVYASGIQGYINFCTIVSLQESQLQEGLIWVGTDDGNVHVTRDGGKNWFETTAALTTAGAPEYYWVTRVAASRHDPAVAYVTKSGFRYDKFDAQVYKTVDYGQSWKKIVNGLPDSPVNIIYEDHKRKGLLFLGNDLGVYVSLDDGENWSSFKGNMPFVSVKDLLVHPRENDLVIGSYGRGLFITDIGFLREVSNETLVADVYLFDIEPGVIHHSERQSWGGWGLYGDDHLRTPNEPAGLRIRYHLNETGAEPVAIEIKHAESGKVYSLTGPTGEGLQTIYWHSDKAENVKPGAYRVILKVKGKVLVRDTTLKPARAYPIGQITKDWVQ